MRSIWRPLTYVIFSTFFVLLLTACGLVVSNPALFGGGDAAVSITLTGASTVMLGGRSQYAATVTGSSDNTVTWSVNGVAGGSAAAGSISATGLYVAPASAPQSSNITITATSVATPTVSKSLPVALAVPAKGPGVEPVTLTLNGASSVTLGTSSQYTATVTGSTNIGVTWSVDGVAGGNATVGTVSASGLYVAPASEPQSSQVTITATSLADPSVSQSLAVSLAAPPPPSGGNGGGGSTVELVLSGATSVTLGASSQYTATVTGSSNTGVSWSVNGALSGNATVGTVSASGFYTAPASEPQSSQVTITATSLADPSVSQSLAVSLVAAPGGNGGGSAVTMGLSGATTVTLSTSSQYTATVTGSSNTGVSWSVNGVLGGNATVGTISAKGRYAAPKSEPKSSKVTIKATSMADPTVSQSLAVSLVAAPAGNGGGSAVTMGLSGATTVTLSTSSQYTATVTGSSNKGVSWSVDGVLGGNATVGTVSAKGRYAAPTKEPRSSEVTITATSLADPSVSRGIVVTLVKPPTAPGGNGGGSTVTLALSGATTVMLGTSSQYSATVTGNSDIGVIWSVNGVTGGDASAGIISTKGRYTAPKNQPRSSKVTITATSLADPSVSQSLAVTLASPPPPSGGGSSVTVTLSGATSVKLGTSSQYSATVTGSTNTGVIWSVDGMTGGDASVGTISTQGNYSAPASEPPSSKVTITATSVADTTVSQDLVVTINAPPPPPNVALTLSGAAKVTLGTSSQYAATVTGSTNTGITWSVNGVNGGSAAAGSISAGGLYTAPATAPQPSTVTIAATSVADPSVAKSLLITLVPPSTTTRIPSNAIASSDLNASTRWQWNHDGGTPGSSQGSTVYPVAGMSSDNVVREFYMTYSGRGGEIYHVSFATDMQATHFVYDANVYVVDPSQLANLEMDMNDVTADGKTIILGTQCSTYSKSWEYTLVAGGHPHWHASNIPCDPTKWSANTWHHIQIASHRDNSGNATYDWVGVDGQYTDFQNATGADALSLGWAKGDLLINFQIDGFNKSSGSNTLYTDKLIVYRW